MKIIALSPNLARHRDELLELLWPDSKPAAAANSLRYTLHQARQILAATFEPDELSIERRQDQLLLSSNRPIVVDVHEFERASELAREAGSIDACDRAIISYTGDLLPEDRYSDWATGRRDYLRATFLALLQESAGLHAREGNQPRAILLLQQAITLDPVAEPAHVALMQLYALSGRRREALQQYRVLEAALRHELDVSPEPATRQLHADIAARRYRTTDAAPSGAAVQESDTSIQLDALPQYRTSFVGRERDITAVTELLESHQLVTLTGAGGIGKTRLAAVVASELEDRYADGIREVDMSVVSDPALAWPVIASALGARDDLNLDGAGGLDGIAARDLLLLLDNCEHLSASVSGIVTALIEAGDGIRILATSREVLRAPGEVTWEVQPLALPGDDAHLTLEKVRDSEAVGLFLDRLRIRQPDFMLTPEIAPYAVDICRQLDGLPLAIEMAAARAAALSLPDLARRLNDAISLLASGDRSTPTRHETLRAALDWSYGLLSPDEQAVFARLSAFPGSWSLDAAEFVAAGERIDERDVVNILLELLDKSLVVREGDALVSRYRYLAPVRQYAVERLEASGEPDDVRRRHAVHFLAMAEAALPELRGPDQATWMERLEREQDNMRAAIAWTLDNEPLLALQLAVTLGRFWYMRNHLGEGRSALSAALTAAAGSASHLRGEALYHAGILADEAGDHDAAFDSLQQSLALFRKLGDPSRIASALNSLGVVARATGDLDHASQLLEESLAIRRQLDEAHLIASTSGNLALVEWSRGNLDRARALLEETLTLARDAGDEWSVAIAAAHLGRIAWERSEYAQALDLFAESLKLANDVGDRGAIAEGLEGLAGALAGLRLGEEAARLWGSAAAMRESLELPVPTPELPLYQRMVASGRSQMDVEAFNSAWAEGALTSPEEMVGRALDQAERVARSSATNRNEVTLTARQREIAGLVACGLTNQQIASQLGIAQRTVDTHVSNILRKLGCSSRTELAAISFDERT